MAKKKFTVKHDSLYLSVGGKLQKVAADSEVVMEEASAKNLVKAGKLVAASDKKSTTVDSKDDKK